MNSAYLGDCRAVTMTVFGSKIFVDTRDEGIAPHLLLEGQWEEWIGSAMDNFLPGSLFIDVGANFGWYTLRAAKKGARKILSFEPNTRLFDLLKSGVRVNGVECELHPSALSDEPARWILQADLSAMGSGKCVHRIAREGVVIVSEGTEFVCRSQRLDFFVSDLLEREPQWADVPVVVKIDVEGFEPKVVSGGAELFKVKTRPITAFIESNPEAVGFVDMLEFFETNKYVLSLVEHTGAIRRIDRKQLAGIPPAEMLCFRRFSE